MSPESPWLTILSLSLNEMGSNAVLNYVRKREGRKGERKEEVLETNDNNNQHIFGMALDFEYERVLALGTHL